MIAPDAAIRNRRAIGLIPLMVFLPGVAQYVAGNRGAGRTVLRIRGVLVAFVLLTGLGLYSWRGPAAGFLLNGTVTVVMRILVQLAFPGWLILLLDAWHPSRPPDLRRRARLVLTETCLVLVVAIGLGTSLLANTFAAVGYVSDVFIGGGDSQAKRSRYNILLLGVDAAADREGTRPDPINVTSIDAETGHMVVFGLPRNPADVPSSSPSPLAKLYPDGSRCGEGRILNGVYTLGQEHADLHPGEEASLAVMKKAVSETLDPELNYYAMVDLAEFQKLVDAMGGINLDIGKRTPTGGIGSEIYDWIEPGTNVHLDGYHALWFARSRTDSDDYERITRQKCVMAAMAKQLDPDTVTTKFIDLTEVGSDIACTDAGTDQLPELVELMIKGKTLSIESVNFAPPLIRTSSPDFTLIRRTMTETIDASKASDTSAVLASSSVPVPTNASSAPMEKTTSQSFKTKTSSRTAGGINPSPSTTPSADTPVCRIS